MKLGRSSVAYTVCQGTESSMSEAKLTIGRIARAAGVHIETVLLTPWGVKPER